MDVVGLDRAEYLKVQCLLEAFVHNLDKRSDPEVARGRLRAIITAFAREEGARVLVTESGCWALSELTEDEKVAFAFEVHVKLKRRLPAATWRGLGNASRP